MNNVICVTSPYSVGVTFLDWSIHFLSGQNHYYHYVSNEFLELSQNPIGSINAHGHKKNHPAGSDETLQMYNHLLCLPNDKFYSIYPIPFYIDTVLNKNNISLEQYKQSVAVQDQVAKLRNADYHSTINGLINNNSPVVVVDLNPTMKAYTFFNRQTWRLLLQNKKPESEQDLENEKNSTWFATSVDTWNKLNLTNIWDRRERDALNIRPFVTDNFVCDFDKPMCRIDSLELWGFGLHSIEKVMSFLQLDINQQRLEHWHHVYKSWQKIQFKILEFVINLDHIIDAIVNNWYYELPNLTYIQEVIIQHCLIYRHNLNLKTWQLEKFPANTQQLYPLLEENIHPVEKYR